MDLAAELEYGLIVTIRDAITGLLASSDKASDPTEALAEVGFSEISPDLFGTALGSFADTASLPVAEALAPIVTRVSAVPFEEGDLPETEFSAQDLDAFSLFEAVHPDPGAYIGFADESALAGSADDDQTQAGDDTAEFDTDTEASEDPGFDDLDQLDQDADSAAEPEAQGSSEDDFDTKFDTGASPAIDEAVEVESSGYDPASDEASDAAGNEDPEVTEFGLTDQAEITELDLGLTDLEELSDLELAESADEDLDLD